MRSPNLSLPPKQHFRLLAQGIVIWTLFWLAGLPSYYRQYSLVALAVGCVLLQVAFSLVAVVVLQRGRVETRIARGFWISLYFTVPFAVLDYLYCGIFLGYGVDFVSQYWYLSVFYLTPWCTFLPTAYLLKK